MRQVVAYKRLKTMENHSISAQKVITVAYWRWSFIRGVPARLLVPIHMGTNIVVQTWSLVKILG